MPKLEEIKRMLTELGLRVREEIPEENILIAEDEERGIKNLIVDLEDDLLVLEHPIGRVKPERFGWFLARNRELPFGAFALDPESGIVLWRQTLNPETLDEEELEASVSSLELFFAERGEELKEILKEARDGTS
ncbi:MAG: type III secretion system chaperone [Aquificae bacterium]|nr:type III secretion system chaperone [Aquificota bacterium]